MRGEINFYNGVRLEIQDGAGKERKVYLKNPEDDLLAIESEGNIYELSKIVAQTFSDLIVVRWKKTHTKVSLVVADPHILFNDEKVGNYVCYGTIRLRENGDIRVDYTPEAGSATLVEFKKLIDKTFAPLIVKAVQKAYDDVWKERKQAERELERKIQVKTHHLIEFENFMKAQGGGADAPPQQKRS